MELKTAIEILEYHQEWRLGKREDMIHEPKKLTQALDIVLNAVKKFSLEKISLDTGINPDPDNLVPTRTENNKHSMTKEDKIKCIKCILIDFEQGEITLSEASNKILYMF